MFLVSRFGSGSSAFRISDQDDDEDDCCSGWDDDYIMQERADISCCVTGGQIEKRKWVDSQSLFYYFFKFYSNRCAIVCINRSIRNCVVRQRLLLVGLHINEGNIGKNALLSLDRKRSQISECVIRKKITWKLVLSDINNTLEFCQLKMQLDLNNFCLRSLYNLTKKLKPITYSVFASYYSLNLLFK